MRYVQWKNNGTYYRVAFVVSSEQCRFSVCVSEHGATDPVTGHVIFEELQESPRRAEVIARAAFLLAAGSADLRSS